MLNARAALGQASKRGAINITAGTKNDEIEEIVVV